MQPLSRLGTLSMQLFHKNLDVGAYMEYTEYAAGEWKEAGLEM